MSSVVVSSVLRKIGLGLVLVIMVVLLTLLFSFLGTITCSVLLGMMLGAGRSSKGSVFFVSLVFPGVIMGLAKVSWMELEWGQQVMIGLLCFGAFWGMYLVALVLMKVESGSRAAVAGGEARGDREVDLVAGGAGEVVGRSEEVVCGLSLEVLQGRWASAGGVLNGKTKVLQVDREELHLTILDSDGRICYSGHGGFRLTAVPISNEGRGKGA